MACAVAAGLTGLTGALAASRSDAQPPLLHGQPPHTPTRCAGQRIGDGAAHAGAPVVTHVGIGEANLGGNGLYALANWKDGGVGYRDGFAGRLTDYQFLGQPYQITLQGAREQVGENWWGDLTHPF